MDDILALLLLDRIYDELEDRYGRAVAWIATASLAAAIVSALVWLLVHLLAN